MFRKKRFWRSLNEWMNKWVYFLGLIPLPKLYRDSVKALFPFWFSCHWLPSFLLCFIHPSVLLSSWKPKATIRDGKGSKTHGSVLPVFSVTNSSQFSHDHADFSTKSPTSWKPCIHRQIWMVDHPPYSPIPHQSYFVTWKRILHWFLWQAEL